MGAEAGKAPEPAESVEPLLLTYQAAMAKLGNVSKSHFYRMLRAGELTPIDLGPKVRRVSVAELEELVKRRIAEAQAAAQADKPAA